MNYGPPCNLISIWRYCTT